MRIFGREIRGIIFDYDGTLLDSGGVWRKIDEEFFAKRGRPVPEDYLESIAHVNLLGAAKITREKYGIEGTDEQLVEEWNAASLRQYAEIIPLKEGAKDVLGFFRAKGIPMVLATAGDKALFAPSLRRLGIEGDFAAQVNVGEIGKSKEFPDIYLAAAKLLGLPPEEIAVFEDMPTGLKSSREAGFYSLAVYDEPSAALEEGRRKYGYHEVKDWPSFLRELIEENE